MNGNAVAAGLADPVFDSQRVFRATLRAFAAPGRALHLETAIEPPMPLMSASAAFLLSTLDFETPLWIQQPSAGLEDYLRFHCGAPIVRDPAQARFALVTDPAAMPELSAFDAGSAEYPDRSATLLVQVPRLSGGRRARLSGPGIPEPLWMEPAGLRPDFWGQWQRNTAAFPCGVDVLFVCGAQLAGMPRTSKAEV